ncbi:MAG TPA: YlqD family protein [Bacillota bacterium]|nr:YlqD family protein [Bacillota bacterium]
MKVIQKVLIKQVITKESKQKLSESFKNRRIQLEQECQQLLFEQKKIQAKSTFSKEEIRRRFKREIDRRKKKIQQLQFKLEQLEILDIGSEIVEREVDALFEVEVGMNWAELQDKKSIVIKDGIIIRIDN